MTQGEFLSNFIDPKERDILVNNDFFKRVKIPLSNIEQTIFIREKGLDGILVKSANGESQILPYLVPVKSIPFNDNEFQPEDTRPLCLFVGIFAPTFDSTFMVRGFEENGYRVEVMDWQKIKFQATVEITEVVKKEGTEDEYEEVKVKQDGVAVLQDALIKKALKEKPDLIFLHIQSENILNTLVVDQLQRIADTVIYNFDCRSKEKTQWLYDLVPYVKLVCFSNIDDAVACRNKGNYNVMVLQSSADYDVYKPLPNKKSIPDEFKHDIVFVGNRYDNTNMEFPEAKARTEMVEFLQNEYGDKFKAWGMGWKYSRLVNKQEEVMIYNGCKIAITQNNFNRAEYQSDRIYRIMGCGAFALMQHFPNANLYFNNDVAAAWLDLPMLKSQIDRYLEDEELREQKAFLGSRFVREKHSWFDRVKQLMIALRNVKKDSI